MPAAGRRPLRFLISSGPTREPLDPVRYLSNYSTGYMGSRLVAEALKRGHRVTVVSGPSEYPLPKAARVVAIEQASELSSALRRLIRGADVLIMAAAVADFRPARRQKTKVKRRGTLALRLEPTPDIVGALPRRKGQLFVGFAVESRNVPQAGARKLREKRLDLLLAQKTAADGSPFGNRRVQAWLVERPGRARPLGRIAKAGAARLLLDKIEGLCYGQTGLLSPR